MSASRIAYVEGGAPALDEAEKLYAALGVDEKLRSAESIFIKLNLCAAQRYKPDGGVCVSASAVSELVRSLKVVAPNARIAVGDSDSTGHGFAHDKFSFQGLDEAAESGGFSLMDLSRDRTTLVPIEGEFFNEIPLAETVAHCDFFVSFSKIKTHNLTRVTGSLKNDFGLLPTSDKKRFHPYLNAVLADLFVAKPPDLVVLDGRPAMEGNGPIHGQAVDLGLTLFGTDALDSDAEMARLMSIPPHGVSHLRHLAKRLGRVSLEQPKNVGSVERPHVPPFAEIARSQKALIGTGLKIQSLGTNIEELGHLVHFAKKLGDVRKVKRFVTRVVRKGRLF